MPPEGNTFRVFEEQFFVRPLLHDLVVLRSVQRLLKLLGSFGFVPRGFGALSLFLSHFEYYQENDWFE